MEGPGLSLFQGSESIQICSGDDDRQEEEEEQEDHKRHKEELNNMLTTGFDDLEQDEEEDNDSSINSSRYHGVIHDGNLSSSMSNSSVFQHHSNYQNPTIPQIQKDYGLYETNSVNHSALENGQSALKSSDPKSDFKVYNKSVSPYDKLRKSASVERTSAGNNYEVPPVVNSEYNEVNNCYEYPYNYDTPSNHFAKSKPYISENGFVDKFDRSDHVDSFNKYGNRVTQMSEFSGEDTSQHYNHCCEASPNGRPADADQAYKTSEYNSTDQLEVLYSIRVKEIKKLTEELKQMQLEKEDCRNQLGRKLAIAQAEIERSNISRNQAQNALVDAKAEISNLQLQLSSMKENNAVLEKTNLNMAQELSIAKNSVEEFQQKIAVFEKLQSLQANDKIHEKFLKQAQEKHATEMRNMQTQIDVLTEKLNAKEACCVSLEQKITDIRRAHDKLMVEKGEAVNRLSQALEESQMQYRNLLSSNEAQDISHLQSQLRLVTQEKEELVKTIQELTHKLEVAKSDANYDALLAFTAEEESDSIRQMKLGEMYGKSKNKPTDDVTNKLRSELQRCLAGQTVKRKEINRLENTLAQKEKELEKAQSMTETLRLETGRYAKRVAELEQELKSLLTEQAQKANAQIQKLSDHLNQVRQQYDDLHNEKHNLEKTLQEALAANREMSSRIQEESISSTPITQRAREDIIEYNKEYLEIHDKAVERVRQEAQVEIVQLSVQLEQTQQELDRVKQLYIDICGTKEELIAEHNKEIQSIKEKYENLESRKQEMERLERDLKTRIKVTEKLTKECEVQRSKIIELERDLMTERKNKEEFSKKVQLEIERAKEEAIQEIRVTHPDKGINSSLPDQCSEHLKKITQLENDCKRLEENLASAVEEQRHLSALRNELANVRLKYAQMEISQETLRKKYDMVTSDHSETHKKLSSMEAKVILNESMKAKYEERISQLELELTECKKTDSDLGKLREERDRLVAKLKNQAKQFEQYISSQKQVAVELNASMQVTGETELQKIKESTIKQVREEMEQKVAEELRNIENQHRILQKSSEEKYKRIVTELRQRYEEKNKEVEAFRQSMIAEKMKTQSSFETQEQYSAVLRVMKTKLEKFQQELLYKKVQIDELREKLEQKELEVTEERTVVVSVMNEWSQEIKDIKTKDAELQEEVTRLRETVESLRSEIKSLIQQKDELQEHLDIAKRKYQSMKKVASDYKTYSKKKENYVMGECKRIEEGYKKALGQIQLNVDALMSTQGEKIAQRLEEIKNQYDEQLEKIQNAIRFKKS